MREYVFYNNKQKERFLAAIDKGQYPDLYWERLFEKTGEREQHHKKDLCDFTRQEAIEVLKWFGSSSYKTLNVIKLNIEKYVNWCLVNTLVSDNQNHFTELDNEIINLCVDLSKAKRMIISKDKFMECINLMDNDVDKYVYMALFEGVSGTKLADLINLKMSDIDESNKTATLSSGKTIPISQQFIDICKAANEQKIQVTKDGRKYKLESAYTIYKRRVDSIADSQHTIQRTIKRLSIDGYDLTAKSIIKSGLIDMINELAIENNCTAEDVLYNKDLFDKIQSKYEFNPVTKKRFLLENSDLLN